MQFHLACLVGNVHHPPKKKSFSHLSKKETQVFIQVKTFKGTVNGAHTFPKEKNTGGLKKHKKKIGGGGGSRGRRTMVLEKDLP